MLAAIMNCICPFICVGEYTFETEVAEYELIAGYKEKRRNYASWVDFCEKRGYQGLALIRNKEELAAFRWTYTLGFFFIFCVFTFHIDIYTKVTSYADLSISMITSIVQYNIHKQME